MQNPFKPSKVATFEGFVFVRCAINAVAVFLRLSVDSLCLRVANFSVSGRLVQLLYLDKLKNSVVKFVGNKFEIPPNEKFPVSVSDTLCTVSVTFCAIGIAFIGYWAFNSNQNSPWKWTDIVVVVLFIIAFFLFMSTVLVATGYSSSGCFDKKIYIARFFLACGMLILLISISFSIFVSIFSPEQQSVIVIHRPGFLTPPVVIKQ